VTAVAHVPICRVLERVISRPGTEPLRIFPILLPMWRVEIRATILDAQPYEVFDRYLSHAIASAGLAEPARLAAFFGVETALVARALQFLESVGHLRREGLRVVLTPLGRRSASDGCRYVVKEDRQQLYFDGFICRPLPRTHYSDAVWCEEPELRLGDRTEFRPVTALPPFRVEVVRDLADDPDRERYNLPGTLTQVEPVEIARAWLPTYVVECVGGLQFFIKAVDGPDRYLGDLVTPFLRDVLAAEPAPVDEQSWREWLTGRGLGGAEIHRLPNRVLRATLPGEVFGDRVPWSRLGSFETRLPSFLQVWCRDESARRRAVLERMRSIVVSGSVRTRTEAEQQIIDLTRQLEIADPGWAGLYDHANEQADEVLREALDRIST
jgi:hypothetical protein